MSKQDRQGVRTPSDIERKYNLGSMSEQGTQQDEKLSQLTQALAQYTAATNAKLKEIEDKQAGILLNAYPIGSVYVSINTTDPTELFGGTWESIAEGQYIVGITEETETEGEVTEQAEGEATEEEITETSDSLITIMQSYTTCYIWKRTA